MDNDRFRFKPCPICGYALLDLSDVYALDEEGCIMEYGKEDAVGLILMCDCGFRFQLDDAGLVDYPCEGWERRFAERADKRSGKVYATSDEYIKEVVRKLEEQVARLKTPNTEGEHGP